MIYRHAWDFYDKIQISARYLLHTIYSTFRSFSMIALCLEESIIKHSKVILSDFFFIIHLSVFCLSWIRQNVNLKITQLNKQLLHKNNDPRMPLLQQMSKELRNISAVVWKCQLHALNCENNRKIMEYIQKYYYLLNHC